MLSQNTRAAEMVNDETFKILFINKVYSMYIFTLITYFFLWIKCTELYFFLKNETF